MSKIYVCEYSSGELYCKRVFQEENEGEANRFAQRRAGGMKASLNIKVIRDGQKIYQIVSFQTKEKEGWLCLKNNKMLALNKSNISKSIADSLPEEAKLYISKITGVNFNNSSDNSGAEQSSEQSEQKEESISIPGYYRMISEMFKY